jgi:uncharacterized membrane protein
VPDYSEFPTTPTRWQEGLWPEPVTTPEVAPPPQPTRRPIDLPSLVAGIVFTVLAIVALSGVDLTAGWLWHGGLVWLGLLVGGTALLVTEFRRARRRR